MPHGPTAPAVEFHGVTKRYGDTVAVDSISFAVEAGEFFSILGPSGCGKTITFRLLAGFEAPDGGAIRINGERVDGRRPYQRPLAMVFQNYALFPHLSVARNIAFGLEQRKRPADEIQRRVRDALADGEIDLPLGAFERQLAHLAEREPVLDLTRALATDHAGGVVVTFDDGYRDFHQHVLPRLVRYRMPALLYLATGLVAEERATGGSEDALSWSGVREAVSTGLVTVGSHTHTHADLSRVSEGAADAEMRRSQELVEDRLGMPCRHFSYPWGVGSQGADRAARRLFDSAALDAWSTNRRGRIDPYRLGRTPILRSDGWFFFRSKVAGVLNGEGLVYRALRRGPWRPR